MHSIFINESLRLFFRWQTVQRKRLKLQILIKWLFKILKSLSQMELILAQQINYKVQVFEASVPERPRPTALTQRSWRAEAHFHF